MKKMKADGIQDSDISLFEGKHGPSSKKKYKINENAYEKSLFSRTEEINKILDKETNAFIVSDAFDTYVNQIPYIKSLFFFL